MWEFSFYFSYTKMNFRHVFFGPPGITSLNRGGLYKDSPKWLKNQKATINPRNNHDKCFQYTITVALN